MSDETMRNHGFTKIDGGKGHWQTFYTEDGGVTVFMRDVPGKRLHVEISIHLAGGKGNAWLAAIAMALIEEILRQGGTYRVMAIAI